MTAPRSSPAVDRARSAGPCLPDDRTEAARPGRPRSAEADRAIDAAALDLFAECGFDGVTIEAVAQRAGVARSTVYRRYPCKADLLVDAAARLTDEVRTVPDTGTIEGDLLEVGRQLRHMLTATQVGRTVPAAIAAAARHPELATAHRAMVRQRRGEFKVVIARAVERDELPADVDADLLLDLVLAPLFYRVLLSGEPVTDRYLRRIVGSAVEGARRGDG
ncbi:MAG: TetR/AcrR family transcriptional regulator [Acidimicrobiales bacterium]